MFGHANFMWDGFPPVILAKEFNGERLNLIRCQRCHLVYWEIIKPIEIFKSNGTHAKSDKEERKL